MLFAHIIYHKRYEENFYCDFGTILFFNYKCTFGSFFSNVEWLCGTLLMNSRSKDMFSCYSTTYFPITCIYLYYIVLLALLYRRLETCFEKSVAQLTTKSKIVIQFLIYFPSILILISLLSTSKEPCIQEIIWKDIKSASPVFHCILYLLNLPFNCIGYNLLVIFVVSMYF